MDPQLLFLEVAKHKIVQQKDSNYYEKKTKTKKKTNKFQISKKVEILLLFHFELFLYDILLYFHVLYL